MIGTDSAKIIDTGINQVQNVEGLLTNAKHSSSNIFDIWSYENNFIFTKFNAIPYDWLIFSSKSRKFLERDQNDFC